MPKIWLCIDIWALIDLEIEPLDWFTLSLKNGLLSIIQYFLLDHFIILNHLCKCWRRRRHRLWTLSSKLDPRSCLFLLLIDSNVGTIDEFIFSIPNIVHLSSREHHRPCVLIPDLLGSSTVIGFFLRLNSSDHWLELIVCLSEYCYVDLIHIHKQGTQLKDRLVK